MTQRAWWIGIVVLASAIALHALLPRYEWQQIRGADYLRIDRWTGTAIVGRFRRDGDTVRWSSARYPAPAAAPAVPAGPAGSGAAAAEPQVDDDAAEPGGTQPPR
jgi:hypothetical protein